MTGSLRIDKGKYYAILNLKDENGKRKQKTINLHIADKPGNKRRAESALNKLLVEYTERSKADNYTSILFCDYIKVWLDGAKTALQPNTYEAYLATLDRHIYPHFKQKAVLLVDVAYSDIKSYHQAKESTLSGNTIKKHHTIILQALKRAVQERIIAYNPARDINLPKAKPFRGKPLTLEQGNELLDNIRGKAIEPVVILAMMFGLRRSEIAGLKWGAIDFNGKTLKVEHTVTRYSTLVAKDDTKNKSSCRVLPLNESVEVYLMQLREQQSKDKALLGLAYKDTDYICRWADGRPMSPDYMSHAFKKITRKYSLEGIRLHDLRHTCASFMLRAKCNMKEISDWLGHSDIGTTMNIYTHMDIEAKKDVSKKLGDMLSLKV